MYKRQPLCPSLCPHTAPQSQKTGAAHAKLTAKKDSNKHVTQLTTETVASGANTKEVAVRVAVTGPIYLRHNSAADMEAEYCDERVWFGAYMFGVREHISGTTRLVFTK